LRGKPEIHRQGGTSGLNGEAAVRALETNDPEAPS
jgi:hypothetical protein